MSRGPGVNQRLILAALAKTTKVVALGGETRRERAGLVRAAESLERAGLCVVVRLWNDEHTALTVCVANPGTLHDGEPVEKLSVARVPHGTGATLKGSLRDIARSEGVSKSTVWRDLRRAGMK